LFSQEIAAM
jgi:hypothetical protein